jgi:hypothetical protein
MERAEQRLHEELEAVGVIFTGEKRKFAIPEKHLAIYWCTLTHRATLVARKTMRATLRVPNENEKEQYREDLLLRRFAHEFKFGIDTIMEKLKIAFDERLVNREMFFYPGGYVLIGTPMGDSLEPYREKYGKWISREEKEKEKTSFTSSLNTV